MYRETDRQRGRQTSRVPDHLIIHYLHAGPLCEHHKIYTCTFRCLRVTVENVGQFRVLVPPYLALVGASLPTAKQLWIDLGEFINALLKTHNYFTFGDILRKCLCRFLCEMLAGRSGEFKLKCCLFVWPRLDVVLQREGIFTCTLSFLFPRPFGYREC